MTKINFIAVHIVVVFSLISLGDTAPPSNRGPRLTRQAPRPMGLPSYGSWMPTPWNHAGLMKEMDAETSAAKKEYETYGEAWDANQKEAVVHFNKHQDKVDDLGKGSPFGVLGDLWDALPVGSLMNRVGSEIFEDKNHVGSHSVAGGSSRVNNNNLGGSGSTFSQFLTGGPGNFFKSFEPKNVGGTADRMYGFFQG